VKKLVSSLIVLSVSFLSGLFTACNKHEKEVVPQADPFKNEVVLKQFGASLTASLNIKGRHRKMPSFFMLTD